MAAGLGWMSDASSSLEIIIISIVFFAVCVTLFTLCTSCYSHPPEAAHYTAEEKNPSSFSPNEKPQEHWSTNRPSSNEHAVNSMPQSSAPPVPDRLHTRSYTMVQPQLPKVNSHNRAESHGYFSQGMIPQLPDAPAFTVGPAGSAYQSTSNSPLFQSTFHQPRVLKDHETLDTEDQTNANSSQWLEVSNEHLYESIGMGHFSKTFSSYEAAEDQQSENSESLYETVGEARDPTSSTMMDNRVAENPALLFQPLSRQGMVGTEIMDVYAAVNFKNKSQKIKELPLSSDTILQDEDDVDEEVTPPVPEKLFK